jgi:hypothetical protein
MTARAWTRSTSRLAVLVLASAGVALASIQPAAADPVPVPPSPSLGSPEPVATTGPLIGPVIVPISWSR